MSDEDLQAIRAVVHAAVREEIGAAESRIRAAVREEIGAAEKRITAAYRAEIAAAESRMSEATAVNLSDLRNELTVRMETMEKRFDNLAPIILTLDTRLVAFSRKVDQVLSAHGQMTGSQAGLDRIIRQILSRLDALEHNQPGQQQ